MQNKTKLIIIAGPQSSGKTTVINLLKKKYPYLAFIEEINQYTLAGKSHMGAPFVTKKMELQIGDATIKAIRSAHSSGKKVIIETGIFHLAWLEEACGSVEANSYFTKYILAHDSLDPRIIFIDTKPTVSFFRRKKIYLKRIRKAGIIDVKVKDEMLAKYKIKIVKMYPYFLKYYHKIPFKKIMIRNSYKKYDDFIDEVSQITNQFLNS